MTCPPLQIPCTCRTHVCRPLTVSIGNSKIKNPQNWLSSWTVRSLSQVPLPLKSAWFYLFVSTVAHSLFLTVTFEYRESVTPKHCILWRAFPVNSQTNNTTITFFCHIFYFFSECFYSASIFFYISCQHLFILFSLCQLRSIIFYVFNRNFYFFSN